MKERPILFSGPMVRAILEGRKTQTRRVVKPQPSEDWNPVVGMYAPTLVDRNGGTYPGEDVYGASDENEGRICPYGLPGDRLWVKETWWQIPEPSLSDLRDGADTWPEPIGPQEQRVGYYADGDDADVVRRWGWKLRPSIFMFRWASRITLEITDVRVQRLQEISEDDAKAEGGELFDGRPVHHYGWRHSPDLGVVWSTPIKSFQHLWDSINGKTHPWASNPWLWALTFKRV